MKPLLSSDNVSGTHPAILQSIYRANSGTAAAYGDDEISKRAIEKVREVFEAPNAEVLFCTTGTAANAIALASLTPPWGCIFCHPEAHIETDECGAPEFFSHGAKLSRLPDNNGKISTEDVKVLTQAGLHGVHNVRASGLSITQCTELGLVYSLREVRELANAAKSNGLMVHMDGARFANAVVSLDSTPAEASWRLGVDVLCLGATKNGALAAEVIISFSKKIGEEMEFRRKRAGHLLSKMRFISAQIEAYLTDNLWLENAQHANLKAQQLAERLSEIDDCYLAHPCEANEVFVYMPKKLIAALQDEGFVLSIWTPGDSHDKVRFVCAFDTPSSAIIEITKAAQRLQNNLT